MRIFQAIDSSTNPAVPSNRTWHRNLYEPLVEMGHDVVLFSTRDGRLAMQRSDSRGRAAFSERLVREFRRAHDAKPISLFFAYLMDGMVERSAIDEIRRSGVPTCNFSCNNAHQFDLVDGLSPHFDYSLHSEKDAAAKFSAIGATPHWWPMASNPTYFKPIDVRRDLEASFVGANYALRARYVAHLLQNGIDLHAFGPHWVGGARSRLRSLAKRVVMLGSAALARNAVSQAAASARLADHDFRRSLTARFPRNCHPPVDDDTLIALYSRSHVSLGLLEVYDQHDPSRVVTQHLHLREFEAPMCGALYCTGYTDELAEMFDPEKEVVTYRNMHELLDKAQYYIRHPVDAERIRHAGRVRALAQHTYHARYRDLFRALRLV